MDDDLYRRITYDEFYESVDSEKEKIEGIRTSIKQILSGLLEAPVDDSSYSFEYSDDYSDDAKNILKYSGSIETRLVGDDQDEYIGLSKSMRRKISHRGLDDVTNDLVECFKYVVNGSEEYEDAATRYRETGSE